MESRAALQNFGYLAFRLSGSQAAEFLARPEPLAWSLAAAQEEYEALLAEEGHEEVATLDTTWAGRLREEGIERGIEQGKRDLLLDLLERRFGPGS